MLQHARWPCRRREQGIGTRPPAEKINIFERVFSQGNKIIKSHLDLVTHHLQYTDNCNVTQQHHPAPSPAAQQHTSDTLCTRVMHQSTAALSLKGSRAALSFLLFSVCESARSRTGSRSSSRAASSGPRVAGPWAMRIRMKKPSSFVQTLDNDFQTKTDNGNA